MRSFFLFLFAASLTALAQPTNVLVEGGTHHLGQKPVATFPAANRAPTGPRLHRAFEAQSNPGEWTLRLTQRNVIDDCLIELNGQRIARLNIGVAERLSHFPIPANVLIDGPNNLTITPGHTNDNILVGQIEIIPQPMRDLLKLARVTINVTEPNGRVPVPARVTITTAGPTNQLAELYNVQPSTAAWRKGVFYTGGGQVEFDLPQGDFIVSATRGMEWSRAQINLRVFIGQNTRLTLPLSHEIDTPGFIAADTHLHTYTFSRHGDASLDERIHTLAGEGVEFAVATDHNHFTDYKPRRDALGLSQYFTSVIGNEVTSPNGHFNAFPFNLDSTKPNHKETNWVKLVADIRAQGAQYVILNHPRWPAINNSPFSIWGLNRADGTRTNEVQFTMDAIELSNSTFPVPPKDPDFLLRDWFALLNRGERIWAVGASDTHSVYDPPGQGRTYVASATDDPATIDVNATIKAMQAGNMSVSYGIFARATANGARMGQLTKASPNELIEIKLHVACPNWITARRAVIYLNGQNVAEQELTMTPRTPLTTNLTFNITAPKHDAHLICVAYGDGVKDPAWKTYADYTLAVTNPIFIDANNDRKYESPRETALALLKKIEPLTSPNLEPVLTNLDPAIAIQLLTEARLRLPARELHFLDQLLQTHLTNYTK